MLPKISKLATDFRKSKEVVAAGPNAVKLLTEVIDLLPQERKTIEKAKLEFEQNAAQKVDVQIMVVDWNNKPLEDITCWAIFQLAWRSQGLAQGGKLNSGNRPRHQRRAA